MVTAVRAATLALAVLIATSACGLAVAAVDPQSHAHPVAAADQSVPEKQFAFRASMRKLWEDHITWTRQVIVSLLAGSPDTDAALTRLLQNQADIGNAIRPFYGDAAADRLTALLRDHIVIAGRLLVAAKSGDAAAFASAKTDWYANGDDIAAFLSSANPKHWPLDAMRAAMRTHLDTTLAEAVARLQGNWTADVAAYDAVHVHILHMADVLSAGIIAQFPGAFSER